MNWMIATGALVLAASGCTTAVDSAKTPEVGASPRAAARSVFLDVGVERATGERIAGTHTQLDLMRPLKFSAYAADGSHVDVEIFAEPAIEAADGYRVSLEVRESDKDGRTMSWRPALSLTSGKEAIASIDWAGDGRRLRVRLSEDPLDAGPAREVVFGTASNPGPSGEPEPASGEPAPAPAEESPQGAASP